MMTGLRIKTAILYRKIKFINEISDQVVNGWYVVDGKKKNGWNDRENQKIKQNLCTWNQIVDKIVICDNVTTLNDMAVRK